MSLLIKPQGIASFNEVPDNLPAIGAGVYQLKVIDVTIEPNKAKTGSNLVLTFGIENDGPFKGRKLKQWVGLPNEKDDKADLDVKNVRIKQIFTACEVAEEPEGGFDAGKLKNRNCWAEAGPRMGKDDQGRDVEQSDIQRILKPSKERF